MEISFLLYTLPVIALLCAGIYAAGWAIAGRKRYLWPRHLLRWCALTYFAALIFLTILIFFDLDYYTISPLPTFLNLRPFAWITEGYSMGMGRTVRQLLLNIGMFVPAGFLLPAVFPKLRKTSALLRSVFLLTLGIETVQYFIGRSADVDDLMMNFLGGALGLLAFRLANRLLANRKLWRDALTPEETEAG